MKTIKLSIIIILSIIFFADLYGQRNAFEYGLLFNVNGIHLEGEEWGGGAISIGSFVTRDLSKKVSGTVEIRYTQKGGNFEYSNAIGVQEYEIIKLRYLEIPVLIGFNSGSNIRKFSIETGFSYGKLINANMIFKDFTERPLKPIAENFRNMDLSWIASLKFHTGLNRKIVCGFRFSHSILSIHDYLKLYNMTFGFEINYLPFK